MRFYVLLTLLFISARSLGQVTDDFSDGDFTMGTVWSGTSSFGVDDAFEISETDDQLRSQNLDMGSGTRTSYLSTPDVLDLSSSTAEWNFRFRLGFSQPGTSSTNSNNTSRVYLMSNSSDLSGDLNGYYVELRYPDSDINEVRLYRQDAATETELNLSGSIQALTSQDFVNVTVSRSEVGLWELKVNTISQGTATDNTHTSSTHFGVQIRYTANSRDNGFYFDDFSSITAVVADTTPPTISSVEAVTDGEVQVTFSEDVDETTAESIANYAIDNAISVLGATRDPSNFNEVTLSTSSLANGQSYTVTINNVQDLGGNTIATDSEEAFQYLVFEEADQFDVVINEFMADPDPPIGLPNAEYVELYNNSSKYFNLESWTLDGQPLPAFTLAPDEYVIVVEDDDALLFGAFANVISITTLSLNNSSEDVISLEDDVASSIFSISYTGSTDGTSAELINPNGPDYSMDSYGLSEDGNGGTPGAQNSIFDDTPDTTAPEITSISAVSETEVLIVFSEKVGEGTAETASNYAVDNGIAVTDAVRDESDFSIVTLTVSALTSGVTYTVTINGVEDLSENAIQTDSEETLFYVVFEEAEEFDVVINEFLADPEPALGLPAAEFVELYNRSSKYLNLENWTLDDQTMPSHALAPDDYVIVIDDDDASLFSSYDEVILISSLGLSNSGDEISLADDVSSVIHAISYESSSDGISTELINPNGPDYSSANYGLSADLNGGTPGEQNAIFDDTPDTTSPAIESVEASGASQVTIFFDENVEKASAETVSNYSINNGISITGAHRDDADFSKVILTVSALSSGTTYTVAINNVEDLSGNVIGAEAEGTFFYVVFEEATEFDVLINEFMANPEPVIGLPAAEYVELYNRSGKYFNLESWTLDGRVLPAFTLAPDGYVIIVDDDDVALFDSYSEVLAVSSLSLTNSGEDEIILLDDESGEIHTITFLASTAGTSTELINPDGPDYSIDNYGLSEDVDGGTPGGQNSIFDDTPDTTAPEIVSVFFESETEVIVTFSEKVEEGSAEAISNYNIDNGILVTEASRDNLDFQKVVLTVSTLSSGTTYTVAINNVEDLSGNVIGAEAEGTFFYVVFEEATEFDVLINEFMANPEPVIGLPAAEYVELYNRSGKYFNLESWTLDGRVLPAFTLAPDGYVIIVDDDDVALFDSYSEVLAVSSLSLTNSGEDEIILLDDESGEIHTITFLASTAGTSTELINPDGPDYSIDNYGLSEDVDGGTPGGQNSIFDDTPDTTAPEIVSVFFESETEVIVTFSEKVEEGSAEAISNYNIDNGILVTEASRDNLDFQKVVLTVSTLSSGTTYTVAINNVEDLSGNVIGAEAEGTFFYVVFEEATEFDVLINEFMANPEPVIGLPAAEYVELYNRSGKYFNLESWTLDGRVLPAFTLAPDGYVIIVDDDDVALFDSYSEVLAVSSLSLTNSGEDEIILLDDESGEIHTITFLASTAGTSTELINPDGPDYSIDNYGLSEEVDGGTPGERNSIFDDTPDTVVPEIVSVSFESETEVIVTFSEKVEEGSAEAISNYSIDNGILVTEAGRDDTDFSKVILTVSALSSGTTYTLSLSDIEDLSGNVIEADAEGTFLYVVFEEAEVFDVLINEFMADPEPSMGLPAAEYVELFNRSDKYLDLGGWSLNDRLLPSFILAPASYALVIDDNDQVLFTSYSEVVTISSLSLSNSEDEIILVDDESNGIHTIAFSESISGISTELINPDGPDYSIDNYGLSEDVDGGTPGERNSIFDDTPDTTPPALELVEVVSSTELDVYFDEPLEKSSAEDVANYAISAISIATASLTEEDNRLVHLMVDELVSLQEYSLTVSGVRDLSGNTIDNGALPFQYIATQASAFGDVVVSEFMADPTPGILFPESDFVEVLNVSDKYLNLEGWTISDATGKSDPMPDRILAPGEYLILTSTSAVAGYELFGAVVGVNGFPNLNEGGDEIVLVDSAETLIAGIIFGSELIEDAVSAELVNPQEPCISSESYILSKSSDGATPGSRNSVFDETPDTEPPFITSYGYQTSLMINFSEQMDASTLINIASYESTNLTPDQAEVEEDYPRSVEITFSDEVIEGVTYEITISGLKDCWGNELEERTIEFGLGRAATFNEILITEIFYDATPSVGLPEREYVEIYNNTLDILSTEGVALSDATSSAELPSFNLEPNTYYILTSNAGASEFSFNAVGVSGIPSFNDTGELLTLSNMEGLIFSVEFDPEWQDQEKEEGGYSLELVDITNPCLEGPSNWRSSIDPKGGTPGQQNSITEVIPDSFGPEIESVVAISPDTIQVDLSEKIDPTAVVEVIVSISPMVDISEIQFRLNSPRTIFILLDEELPSNQLLEVSLTNLFDCAGNEVSSEPVTFALPLVPKADEIKLSEVLFNPRSGGVDFVEVFNDSEDYLSLKGWQLARVTEEAISNEKEITAAELVISPGAYLVFTTDPDVLLNNYPQGQAQQFFQVASLPGYSDSDGTVVLLDNFGEVVEQFSYDEDQHYDLLEDNDGVSLERISFDESVANASNWRSASSTEGFATPGYANSQAFSPATQVAELMVEPKVFIPGNAGSGRDFTTINYQFQSAGQFANVNIYDQSGRLIRNLVQGELLSTSGFIRWDGETNDGSIARMGYYVVLFEVYDVSGNTEIIKETVVVGRDF